MKPAAWILALVVAAVGAFLIGRSTGPAREPSAPRSAPPATRVTAGGSTPHDHAQPLAQAARDAASAAAGERPATASTDAPATADHRGSRGAPPAPSSLAACTEQLQTLRETVATTEANHLAAHGEPAAPPAAGAEPRFAQAALRNAATAAFEQAKVPGGVDGVDCAEYPRIIHGRISGTEDDIEPLEQARAFDAYDDDISTILLWVRTDEAAEEAAERKGVRDERAEQALFAIAFYSHADASERGDDLDRRIRWRVGELWTTVSPRDETGARPE